ncbi:MAG: Gx transporter family protein [Lachnospiraceae bacterium]|nr:Gx transporter family protein [Lachnospiraceae bacterium]
MKSKSLKVSFIGMMVALSFVLSYIESLIPLSVGIPGVKAGLSNIPVMVMLYMAGPLAAGILALVKVTLVSATFGSMSSFFYSLGGAMLSIIIMAVFKRLDIFTVRGVSILGGIMHNMGQLIVAVFIVENAKLFYYLPILIISGIAAGLVIGLIADLIIRRIGVLFRDNEQK